MGSYSGHLTGLLGSWPIPGRGVNLQQLYASKYPQSDRVEGGIKNADIEPCAKIEKDTKDVKALVMHSVYVWGCENVPMAGREREPGLSLTIRR